MAPTTTTAKAIAPFDAALAATIPVIEGYHLISVGDNDLFWTIDGRALPDDLTTHHARVVADDGTPIARVVLAGSDDGAAIDAAIAHTFSDVVQLPLSGVDTDDGYAVVSNSAVPAWTDVEGHAVIRAEQDIDHTIQWLWGDAGVVWLVRGTAESEDYVRSVLRAQAASPDPFDQQGLTGSLFEHTPPVSGYVYYDLPRAVTLASVPNSPLNPCVERYYVGYVRPEDADATPPYGDDDLTVVLAKTAGACTDELDSFAQSIAEGEGVRTEEIAGRTVARDDNTIRLMLGDVLVILGTNNPSTIEAMMPFITKYLAAQPV